MSILSPKFRSVEFYSDFPKTLEQIPGRNELSRKLNENAVKEAIRNIVLTEPGERVFQPNFGCGIKGLLFEQIDPTILSLIKEKIESAIETYEPRCEVVSVEVTTSDQEHTLLANIFFRVINTDATSSVKIQIQRVR